MKLKLLATLAAAALAAGCATTAPVPAGLVAGKFVDFDCEGQDFQARFNPDGNTVRVRTQRGSAELAAAGDGVFQADGFRLLMKGPTGITIEHGGKPLGQGCKRK